MRAGLLLLPGLLVLTLAPSPAAGVSDDAFLALESLFVGHADFSDGAPRTVEVLVDLVATDDAPQGNVSGHVAVEVRHANATGPGVAFAIAIPYDVEVGEPELARRHVLHRFNTTAWMPSPGLYNVTATLWPADSPGPWDTRWIWYQAGHGPVLGTGWGRADFQAAASFDADGDGLDDIWLAGNATGEPAARPLALLESTQRSSDTDGVFCGRHLWLDLSAGQAEPIDVRVSADLVQLLLPDDGGTLRLDTQSRGGEAPAPVGGAYAVTVGHQNFGTRFDHILFIRVCPEPAPLPEHTWGHGFRTTANVTHWDLNGDGAMDVRFWHTNATSVEEAQNETVERRRAQELVLIAQAHVEHRTTRRVLTFELARPGGGHEGAWVEIQDATDLFLTLLGAPDNASISYRLSLPANESFVEQDDGTTWAWIGHFSTQTLTVVLDASSGSASSPGDPGAENPPEEPKRNRWGVSGPGAALVALALAVAAACLPSRR